MQFFTIYTSTQQGDLDEAHMAAMGSFVEEQYKAGTVLMTGGLMPSARAQRVDGEISISQTPATRSDARGFALLQVESREQLDDLIRQFLNIAGDGVSEVYQVAGPEDM